MDELALIWSVSLLLAAAALAWMTALIVARLFRERSEGRRERDRRLIQQAFLDIMAGSGDAVGRLRAVRTRARVMAEALLGVVGLVRGAERERLIDALAAFGLDRTFRRRLSRGSIAGRIVAAEALSIFPGPEGATALRRTLGETRSADLRVSLWRSLIDLGQPPALEAVLADLKGRNASDSLLYVPLIESVVTLDAASALRTFGDPDLPAEARVILAEALGRSGDYRVLEPLCLTARAPDDELRIASMRGLASLGHPSAEPSILAAIDDPVWMVRAAACEAAGRIGLRTAIPRLASQLEDPVWWVRFRAGEALVALGEPGRDRLVRSLVEGGDLARRTASMVLAERGLPAEAA